MQITVLNVNWISINKVSIVAVCLLEILREFSPSIIYCQSHVSRLRQPESTADGVGQKVVQTDH